MIVLPGCSSHRLMPTPHTIVKYDQVGDTCVYSEEYGQHMVRSWPYRVEDGFYVRLNRREIHFAGMSCSRIIEANLADPIARASHGSLQAHYEASLRSETTAQEEIIARNLEMLQLH